jgi:hypothetical protein
MGLFHDVIKTTAMTLTSRPATINAVTATAFANAAYSNTFAATANVAAAASDCGS